MGYSIALIGVPGSGKTDLANAISDYIIKDDAACETCNTPVAIVDDYAEYIEDYGKWAIGLDGGWASSLAITMERLNRERAAWAENKSMITCGTLLESAVYMTMHFEAMYKVYSEDQVQDALVKIEAGMRTFAALYADTFQYGKVFYLPPGTALNDQMKVLDKNIQAAFQAFKLVPVEPLIVEPGPNESLVEARLNKIFVKENDEIQAERSGVASSSSE